MAFQRATHRVVPVILTALVLSALSWLPVWAQDAQWIRVTLLQLNDVYTYQPVDKGARGGLARVATLVKAIRQESPNTVLVLGGDTLSPSLESRLFQGRQMIAAWNALGLDLAVVGNHEFDFGAPVLRQRLSESRFPWLGANVESASNGRLFDTLRPYVLKRFPTENGQRPVTVGFVGVITPDTASSSAPGPTVRFSDPLVAVRRQVSRMRREGATVLVGLTHLPMWQDQALAHRVPLDVILGGHEHTLLQSFSGKTPIFKAASDAVNLGRVDLFIDPKTGRVDHLDWQVIPVTAEIAADPQFSAQLAPFDQELAQKLDQPVGASAVVLNALQAENRSRETNLGDFVADSYRLQLGTDVAFLNGGSIRTNTTVPAGPLTRRQVMAVLPFGNPVMAFRLTGNQLKQVLEHGVSRLGAEESGRFLQVSGLTFQYDGRNPVGQRVVSVSVAGQPLDERKVYTAATTQYLLKGGDGFDMLKGLTPITSVDNAFSESDTVLNQMAKLSQIAPAVEGRIHRLDTP
jgi:5'-nucleotidase